MASQVIEEIVSKDQRNPPTTTTEDRKTNTCSPPIEDRTTACSPICPKVQEKFLPQKEPQKASNHLPGCSKANDHEIPPRKLSHLIKGIKKKKAKSIDTPRGEGKKDKSVAPVEAPILMINREDCATKNTISESMDYKEGITFPPVTRLSNAPVIIEAAVFRRNSRMSIHGQRKHMRGYLRTLLRETEPYNQSHLSKHENPLVGFLGKRSWSVGEVLLEIIIGEHPFSREETLNFVIVKSNSPHNMTLYNQARHKSQPFKLKAATKVEQPRALKDIQSLNRKLAALSRFLSKGAERSLPFFKVLKICKGKKKIHWTNEADKAFKEMKKFVQAFPKLTAPKVGETLIMYLAASKENINVTLFAKRSKGHIPIYFVRMLLHGAELNYHALENPILALVHVARRLRRYFQAHTIMVLTGTPIKQALTRHEKTGRVAKWAIKLGEHDIVFLKIDEREMQTDFLPEIPFDDIEKRVKEKEVSSNEWKLYTDEAFSSDEYEALLAGLRIAQEIEITKVEIFLHSQLVVKTALKGFKGYTIEHVRRSQNKKAEALSKLASMTFEHLTKEVLVEVLAKRSIEEKEVLKVEIKEKRSWMSPIQEYLLSGLLPEDTKEARKIRIQVPQYKLI
nr:hypothetical protein [Tanacetum cinerariifolium]